MTPFDVALHAPKPGETVLIEASAGTGKTHTIASLVDHYVTNGVPLDKILILTFNRNAVHELRERMRDATVMTLHEFCRYVLRELLNDESTLVEDLGDLQRDVIDDIFVGRYLNEMSSLTYANATELGLTVMNDGLAEIAESDDERTSFTLAVRAEFAARKRRERVMSFDDVLVLLADALSAETVEQLRSQFSVVLVDEFQDTDATQWAILQRAFVGHSSMVMVGDPKQAIYSFRGGDITTYEVAKREVDAHYTLATNWRSDNQLLAALDGVIGGLSMGEGIAVYPVTGTHEVARIEGAPLRLRCAEANDGSNMPIDEARRVIFNDLAGQIGDLLDPASDLKPSDIAVITTRIADLEWIHRVLRAAGIPSVVTAGSSVYTTDAANDWLLLLQCLERPTWVPGLRSLAMTSFVGVTTAELDADGDRITDDVADLVRELKQVATTRGLNAVVEVLLSRGLVERLLAGKEEGSRHLTDLQHIGELVAGRTEPRTWLAKKVAKARESARGDERLRRLDTDADAVQLMTVHAAKGLQWPVVFLPTLFNRNVQQPAVPRFHLDGARYVDVTGGGPGNVAFAAHAAEALRDEAEESLRQLYVALTRAESQATMWWAPTRDAAHGPVTRVLFGRGPGGAEAPDSIGLPFGTRAVADQLAKWSPWLSIEAAGVGPVDAQSSYGVGESTKSSGTARTFTRTVDTRWWRSSYSALTAGTHDSGYEAAVKDDEEDIATDDTEVAVGADIVSPMAELPAGNVFGSLVHGVLENIDVEAGDLAGEIQIQVGEQIVEWGVDVDPGMLTAAMLAVLESPILVSTGSTAALTLKDIANRDKLREMSFEVPLAGGDAARGDSWNPTLGDLAPLLRKHLPENDPVRPYADVLAGPDLAGQNLRGYLTGSIDLAFRTNGQYFVVDYKTNWLGGREAELTAWDYRPEVLTEAMNHSDYPLQAILYTVVLHRYLTWRLDGYDPREHLGGVLYLYLRGMCGPATPIIDGQPCGVFSWKPPVAFVEAVSELLEGRHAG